MYKISMTSWLSFGNAIFVKDEKDLNILNSMCEERGFVWAREICFVSEYGGFNPKYVYLHSYNRLMWTTSYDVAHTLCKDIAILQDFLPIRISEFQY